MKNHKEKGSMQPKGNEGKNEMKHNKNVSEKGSMRPEKRSESGKGSMNGFNKNENKNFTYNNEREDKHENERKETGKSKYFGNYKKTCTTDKCCNCNKTNCNCK